MSDCSFQYATGSGRILENTGLITRDEADELWSQYVPQFKAHVEAGEDPEMAIWIDMAYEGNYHKTAEHWCGQDYEVRDGKLYSRIPIA